MGAAEQWDDPGTDFWRLVFTRDFETHRELDIPRGVAPLARATGIPQHTLRENVKFRRLPRLEIALLLAEECGISRAELRRFYPVLDKGRYPKSKHLKAL
jgi:hypothetical protein